MSVLEFQRASEEELALLARQEFDAMDSSCKTNDELWKEVAQKYGFSEDLDTFIKNWETDNEEKVLEDETKKLAKERAATFVALRNSWRAFVTKYSPQSNDIENLWDLFWGSDDAKMLTGCQKVFRKYLKKDQIYEIVKALHLERFDDFKGLMKDPVFMEEIESISRVKRVLFRQKN